MQAQLFKDLFGQEDLRFTDLNLNMSVLGQKLFFNKHLHLLSEFPEFSELGLQLAIKSQDFDVAKQILGSLNLKIKSKLSAEHPVIRCLVLRNFSLAL